MFEDLLDLLNTTKIPFVAYRWDQRPESGAYGTAQIEGGADSVSGDGMILHQGIRASVDLYDPSPGTENADKVQDALNGVVSWRLNSVQYEDDPPLVHYEWIIELEGL